jgi:hypothetical protein
LADPAEIGSISAMLGIRKTGASSIAILHGLANTVEIETLGVSELIAVVAIILTIRWHFIMKDGCIEDAFLRLRQPAQIGIIAVTLVGLFLCSGGNSNAFIYFQF